MQKRCQGFRDVVMSQPYSRPRPQNAGGFFKNTSRADVETKWVLPAQAWERWPIRADWVLKETGAQTEGE